MYLILLYQLGGESMYRLVRGREPALLNNMLVTL